MESAEIYSILLDKGLLALVAVAVGFYFNVLLQKRKARDAFLAEIAQLRVEAYQALWALTMKARYWGSEGMNEAQRRELNEELVNWYYEKNGAMFLSFNATNDLNMARQVLCDKLKGPSEVRDAFSSLRTTIKVDCHIYSESEKAMQLAQPPKRDCL